jgi:hypothetical protein
VKAFSLVVFTDSAKNSGTVFIGCGLHARPSTRAQPLRAGRKETLSHRSQYLMAFPYAQTLSKSQKKNSSLCSKI